jgi:hypothetical protein
VATIDALLLFFGFGPTCSVVTPFVSACAFVTRLKGDEQEAGDVARTHGFDFVGCVVQSFGSPLTFSESHKLTFWNPTVSFSVSLAFDPVSGQMSLTLTWTGCLTRTNRRRNSLCDHMVRRRQMS